MNVIEAKDLYKIYADGDQQINAVDGINLAIEKGEFTAIVGSSTIVISLFVKYAYL